MHLLNAMLNFEKALNDFNSATGLINAKLKNREEQITMTGLDPAFDESSTPLEVANETGEMAPYFSEPLTKILFYLPTSFLLEPIITTYRLKKK